ncbi:MAG: hypothetical protein JXR91_11185 [Deltaproteobacteria bacterium]|nr:hypothetical protein [Deltaproteobacteria bacterium]
MPQQAITTADQNMLDQPTKALMLIMSLEEEAVARILRHLEPEDIRILHELANKEFKPDSNYISTVYKEFLEASKLPFIPATDRKAYIERITQRSLGREKSINIFNGKAGQNKPFSFLETREAKTVAKLLEKENPQVIAAVISELSPSYSANVLEFMDHENRVQVIRRLASLTKLSGQTIESLHSAMEEQLAFMDFDMDMIIDGMGRVASILQRLPLNDTDQLLNDLSEDEPALAFKLRREMFSFEDIINVQGRGMQALIREVSNDQLLMALKTASEELKDKIMSAMSKRAAEILLDDLLTMGPAKLSEVEKSQQEIVDIALRLEAEGKLVIAGRGNEELV